MKLVRVFLVGWVAGWLAGLVMAERWRRLAENSVSVTTNAVESDASGTAERLPATATWSSAILSGARADYARTRHRLGRVVPWTRTSAPTLADVKRQATVGTHAESTAQSGESSEA